MKNFSKILLTGLIFTLWSCDNPVENLDIVIDTDDIINTTIAVELLNVNDGTPISDIADISISGPDADMVLDLIGEKEFKTAGDGLLTMILHPDALPSTTNPVEFTINASVNGYEDISKDVIIKNIGNSVEILELVNYEAPPTGLLFLEEDGSLDANGELTQDLVISSNNNRVKGLGFSFNITFPKGTSFTNAAGSKISGQSVKISSRVTNVANLLGGFIRKTADGGGYSIMPDAQFSLQATIGGESATGANQDFTLDVNFDEDFDKSKMGILFQERGKDPKNLDLSKTTVNGNNVISTSNFFGIYDIAKLIAEFYPDVTTTKNVTVSVTSNIRPTVEDTQYYTDQYSYEILIGGFLSIYKGKSTFRNGSELEIQGLVSTDFLIFNEHTIVVYKDNFSDISREVIGSVELSRGDNILNLTFPTEKVNFNFMGTCDNGDFQIGPTANIYYKPSSSNRHPQFLGTIKSGRMVTHKLEQGVEYEFSTGFNGSIVSARGTVNSNDYSEIRELPANICNNF